MSQLHDGLDLVAVPKQNVTVRKTGHNERDLVMTRKLIHGIFAAILIVGVLAMPVASRAQQSAEREDNGIFVLGSVLLSILHVPFKLVTCIGTQAGAAVAYTATYGVEGHYDGGTNGKDIGETARRSCKGDWIITPSQVKSDYGS